MLKIATIAILSTFTLPAFAQVTWNIQARQLPATILRASAGDVLRVTGKGTFASLTISKPLFIHGHLGAEINSWTGLSIDKIPSGKQVVLQGFKVGNAITAKNCKGSILLADVKTSMMTLNNCKEVAIEACVGTTLFVDRSTVFVSGSTLVGRSFNPRAAGAALPAVITRNSSVLIADSSLTGGSHLSSTGSIFGPPVGASAIALSGSGQTLQLSGNTVCNAGLGPKKPVDAVFGSGTVVYDPGVRFVPTRKGAALARGLKGIKRSVPVTTITRAKIGEMATVALRGVRATPFALFLGRPGASFSIPGVLGADTSMHRRWSPAACWTAREATA